MEWRKNPISADLLAMSDVEPTSPTVVNPQANEQFRQLARQLKLDPDGRWVGQYVEYEWNNGRWLLDGAYMKMGGARVLDFGCNFGAIAIVLATLGAQVESVDINDRAARLGQLNIQRYGCEKQIHLQYISDSQAFPFENGHFDAIVCNSVLEYLPRKRRAGLLREMGRALKPQGLLFIMGTSNRLWPRETHDGRWLVNYLPDWVDRVVRSRRNPFGKGVWPWEITGALRGYKSLMRDDRAYGYLQAKEFSGAHAFKIAALHAAGRCVHWLGLTVGDITPCITKVLQKPAFEKRRKEK